MQMWTYSQPTPRELLWPVAGDAVADAMKAAEALDIEMDQTTRLGIFVTHNRLGGIDILHP